MIIWLTIWYQITQIMLSLFDNYLMIIWWLFGMIIWWLFDDYLMIICFIIWSLFDDYLLIIWWLCDAYLMIIWWLFESNYLMIIWWLFDKWLFGDYSMIIWIWLFLIIRWLFDPNYSWLFDDYLTLIILDYSMIIQIIRDYLMIIWFLGQQQVGWFASFPKAFAWNSLVMAAFRLRKSQPASLACYLLQKLRINWNHPLVFHDDFDPPSALPRSACRVFLREVLDPAITQYLTVSSTQLTNLVCYGVAFFLPCVIRGYASNL